MTALGLLVASHSIGCQQDAPAVAATGRLAPDFSGRDIDGQTIRLSSHLGRQVVLLDFYSTWCEPCVAELPHLKKLYETNKEKGFVILAISLDGPETVANVPGFVRRNQLSFPMMMDEGSRISSLYNPRKAAPLSVLIDRTGRIVDIHEGYTPGDELVLASQIAKALAAN